MFRTFRSDWLVSIGNQQPIYVSELPATNDRIDIPTAEFAAELVSAHPGSTDPKKSFKSASTIHSRPL